MSNAGFDDKHSHPSWVKAMQQTILALKLDAAAVRAILEAWTAAPAGSGAPDRDRIWYRGNRPWVVAQLEAAGLRKAAGITARAVDPWRSGITQKAANS